MPARKARKALALREQGLQIQELTMTPKPPSYGRLCAALLASTLLFAGCAENVSVTTALVEPATPRSSTVLVYLNGTNLEAGIRAI